MSESESPPALRLQYTNEAGNRRRVSFYRRDPGGWDRVIEERDGDTWRGVGGEIVAEPEVKVTVAGVAQLDITRKEDSGSAEVLTGP